MTKQTFLYNDYIAITIIMVIRNQNLPTFNFSSLLQIFCYNDSCMEDNKINVAVVEDSAEDLNNCVSLLNQYGKEKNLVFNIQTFETGGAFLLSFKSQFDFIILDINLLLNTTSQSHITSRKRKNFHPDLNPCSFILSYRFPCTKFQE